MPRIMMGDTDRILDLIDWSNAADGTCIHGTPRRRHIAGGGSTQHMAWKFEHISDETGEETPSSAQIQDALSRAEKTIQTQAAEIEFLRRLILDSRQEAASAQTPQQPPNTTREGVLLFEVPRSLI
ncbi:hypothetical protein FRC11_005718 [Ceratobasidium sp. 423]|nr:hypothetical protein FRC11_005718 [Ceratobasidium sp. 423]